MKETLDGALPDTRHQATAQVVTAEALAEAHWERPNPKTRRSKPPCAWAELTTYVRAGYVEAARAWLTRATELASAATSPDPGQSTEEDNQR